MLAEFASNGFETGQQIVGFSSWSCSRSRTRRSCVCGLLINFLRSYNTGQGGKKFTLRSSSSNLSLISWVSWSTLAIIAYAYFFFLSYQLSANTRKRGRVVNKLTIAVLECKPLILSSRSNGTGYRVQVSIWACKESTRASRLEMYIFRRSWALIDDLFFLMD
jgi:hypothetical protein